MFRFNKAETRIIYPIRFKDNASKRMLLKGLILAETKMRTKVTRRLKWALDAMKIEKRGLKQISFWLDLLNFMKSLDTNLNARR